MKSRKILVALIALAACVGITAAAVSRTKVSHVTFAGLASVPPDQRAQVYGELDPQSIRSVKGATVVEFELVEEETGQRLKVLYDNPAIALPATFPNASHARVSGTFVAEEKRFVGDTVQTKCPTKYDKKVDLDAGRQEAIQRWQKATGLRAAAE